MALYVKVIEGNLTRDTDTVSKMDPYCVISVGTETQKTSAKSGAGKTPKWDQILTFNSKDGILRVVVKDDDVFKDDEIGSGTFNIAPAYNNPNKPAMVPVDLLHKNQPAGKVLLEVEYKAGKW